MAKRISSEELSLQRKFVPANIIICVIALVAAFCMLFMPWVDVRVHIEGEKLASIIAETNQDSSTTASNGVTIYTATDGTEEQDPMMQALVDSLSGLSFDIPVSLYPMKMLSAATGDVSDVEDLFNSMIGKNGAAEHLEGFIDEIAPVVVKALLNSTIDSMFEEMSADLTEEEKAQIEEYKDSINTALDNIAENPSTENAKLQLNNVVDEILADSIGEIAEEDLQQIRDVIDEIVEQGSKDGVFDYVHLLKNLDINALGELMGGNEDGGSNPTPNANTITNKVSVYTDGDTSGDTSGEGTASTEENPLTELINILENPASLIAENLDQEIFEMVQLVILIMFIVFIGLPVFLCFILALSAILHIFTAKKRVRFWYVKFLFFISTIVIVGLNVVAAFVLPTLELGAEAGAILSAFKISFLGSAVVKAGCWVALTILSLFYYRRIKKKIKKLRRAERAEAVA